MKIRLILIVALFPLPFFSFGSFDYSEEITVNSVRFFTWTDFDQSVSRSQALAQTVFSMGEIRASFFSRPYGLRFTDFSSTHNPYILDVPASSSFFGQTGSLNVSINHSVLVTSNGVNNVTVSPLYFPELRSFYSVPVALYISGYRGPGIVSFDSLNGKSHCLNVDLSKLIPDVLSSTNTVYSQILFSQLSAIHSGVVSISSDLSGINSAIAGLSPFSFDQVSNFVYALSVESSGNQIFPWFSINPDKVLDSLDPSKHDLSTPQARDYFDFQRQATVRGLTLAAELAGLSNALSKNPDGSSTLSSLGDSFNHGVNNNLANLSGHVSGLVDDVRRMSTNDWASVVTNRLANNTASITNQLAHMFDDPSAPGTIGSHVANISGAAGILASTVDGGAVSVRLSGQEVFGVHLDAPVSIEENQMSTVTVPLDSLRGNVSRWFSEWTDFYFSSSPEKGWVKYFDLVSDFKDVNHSDLASLSNSVFDAVSSISNLLFSLDLNLKDNFPNLTNGNLRVSISSSFSSLLHEDYSNFVEHSFSDILTNLESQYPDVYDSLQNLGLSEDSYYGRWWNLSASALSQISVSVHSNMLMFSSLMSDIAAVDDLAYESLEKSPLAACRDIVREMPSKTQIEDYISQCTNAANAVSVSCVDLVSSLDAVSNSYVSIFEPFKGSFNSPGSSVTFFKTANGHYVSIPVGAQPRAWLILRLGISFALVAVNILLLPKYILMLFTLFIRAYRIAIKFFPDDL